MIGAAGAAVAAPAARSPSNPLRRAAFTARICNRGAQGMASMSDTGADARDQIRQLREQVDTLLRERVSPAVSGVAGRAQDAARQAREMAQDQTEALSSRVREMPIASVLIAAAAGYLIGRLSR